MEKLVLEEDASTIYTVSPEHHRSIASVDSEDSRTASPCQEGVSTSSQQVTKAEDPCQSISKQDIPPIHALADALVQTASSNFKPHLDEAPLAPRGHSSSQTHVKSELSVQAPRHCQPSACGSFRPDSVAPAAAAAAAASDQGVSEATASQSQLPAARIVGQDGKFYKIMTAVDQQDGDLASLQSVARRYREFASLDVELRQRHPTLPELPQKSVFFRKNFKCGFMDDRKQRLDDYVSALLADPAVVTEPSVQKFLGMTC